MTTTSWPREVLQLPLSARALTAPLRTGGSLMVLDGMTVVGRRALLVPVIGGWRESGLLVLEGAASPLALGGAGPHAVYDALARCPAWTAVAPRGWIPPRPDDVDGWVAELRRAAPAAGAVLVVDGADLSDEATAAFFDRLARCAGAQSPPVRVVVNPQDGPVLAGRRVQLCAQVLGTDEDGRWTALEEASSATPLHAEVVTAVRRLTDDPRIGAVAVREGVASGRLRRVDGVWVRAGELSLPALPLTHPAVARLARLPEWLREIVRAVAVIGPVEVAVLGAVLATPGETAPGVVGSCAELVERGLLVEQHGRLLVPSPLVRQAAAADVGRALADRWRARLAALRTSAPTPASPAVSRIVRAERLARHGRCDSGDDVLDAARTASSRGGHDARVWAGVAALVRLRRGRPDRAAEWLALAGPATDCALTRYARAQFDLLVSEGSWRAGGEGQMPAVPAAVSGVLERFAALQRELERIGTGEQPDAVRLRRVLDGARAERAVLLWCRAASYAREQGLPVGPTPIGPGGEEDLRNAMIAMLAAGFSTVRCAQVLGMSRRGVEKRLTTLYRATNCGSRSHLVHAFLSGELGDISA